jgi:Zn-dependent protease with chaperone function
MLQAAVHAVYSLPPDKLAKAVALAHARNLAYFGGTAWTIFVLWILVRFRLGPAIRDLAAKASRKAWIQGLVVAPIWLVALVLIGLPVSLYMHTVNLRYGLSVEPWAMWWGDVGKSAALTIIFGTIALSVLYALIRHSPRRWWLWFWVICLPVEVVAVFLIPIVIDPMFNHFSPLEKVDPALVQQLEKVAARGGLDIPPSRMFVMDASAKVTGPNAYVTGFGASKRIVVWDTTIRKVPLDEILAIYGHEQGHYVLHHIQKGMAFSVAVMLAFFWFAYLLFTWLVRRRGGKWRIPSVADWSSLGALLLVVTVLSFLADPVGNAFSRHIEHQADVYGQEVIHGLVPNPQSTMAESFQRLGELWLDLPDPNPFIVFWTYSHPPTASRMRFAAEYDAWAPGSRGPKFVK